LYYYRLSGLKNRKKQMPTAQPSELKFDSQSVSAKFIDPAGVIAERKIEMPSSRLELRIVIMVRSNYAPWVRSDHTGFEVMLGDMTTFSAPEQTAASARAFFSS
jgi:hypothetical protein